MKKKFAVFLCAAMLLTMAACKVEQETNTDTATPDTAGGTLVQTGTLQTTTVPVDTDPATYTGGDTSGTATGTSGTATDTGTTGTDTGRTSTETSGTTSSTTTASTTT